MAELLRFLKVNHGSDPSARQQAIEEAVESLRHAPLRCAIVGVRDGRAIRRLVVERRFSVYYIYTPPRGLTSAGTIWVRAVKHAASENPFLGVREAHQEDAAPTLSTRDLMRRLEFPHSLARVAGRP
jgi:hypothetical protein